jgi:hypothetical protein
LAGALIAGSAVVENYLGIDPWDVSNRLCERIRTKLSSEPRPVNVEIRSEIAQRGGWPDADLVFTGPPYAALERYNYDSPKGSEESDGQAWRLVASGKFFSDFIVPLMQNAANATRNLRGRVIINIANTTKRDGGEYLTRDILTAANMAGLGKCHHHCCVATYFSELVEIFGMRLSDRQTSKKHGDQMKRGEPFFVFEHRLAE